MEPITNDQTDPDRAPAPHRYPTRYGERTEMSATENETAMASKTVDDVAKAVQVADTIEPEATTAPVQVSDDATEMH